MGNIRPPLSLQSRLSDSEEKSLSHFSITLKPWWSITLTLFKKSKYCICSNNMLQEACTHLADLVRSERLATVSS